MKREQVKNEKIKFGKFKFIKAWSFPKDVTKFAEHLMMFYGGSHFDDKEQRFVDNRWTHLFCGDSWLGDTRIDVNEKKNVTLVSDYKDLVNKLGFETQDNIIGDPPWQIPPIERMQISYVMRDLCKIGGYVIVNCTWNPWCQGLTEPVFWIPQPHFNNYQDIRVWVVMQRIEYKQEQN